MKVTIKLNKKDFRDKEEYNLKNVKKVCYDDNLITFVDSTDFGNCFEIKDIKNFEVKETTKNGNPKEYLMSKDFIIKTAKETFPEMCRLEYKNGKYRYSDFENKEVYAQSKDLMVYNIVCALLEKIKYYKNKYKEE